MTDAALPRPARSGLAHLRAALRWAPGRPALVAGARAAVTTVAPLAIGLLLPWPSASLASLGGYLGCLVDKGGAYRARAANFGALATAGAAAVALASLAGRHPVSAVLGMLCWGIGANLVRLYRTAFANVVNSATILFAAALATPATPLGALERGGSAALGVVWAMVVALGLGPLRYYRPARLAVARCWDLLAARLVTLRGALRHDAPDERWLADLRRDHPRLREALEAARSTLAATRHGREGESERGERLLVLVETADQLFATVVALVDVLPSLRGDARAAAGEALGRYAARCGAVAHAIVRESRPNAVPSRPPEANGVALPQDAELGPLLDRLDLYSGAADEAVASLDDTDASGSLAWLWPGWRVPRAAALWGPLRANLTLRSVQMRHALRVGLVSAAAVALTHALRLPHGYWVTLAAIVITQPYAAATTVKGLQRVIGTALGGALAALLGTVMHAPLAVLPIVFVLAGIAVSLYPLNYAIYAVFSTGVFVLLAELRSGDWHLALVRIENTLLGAALALAGTWVLLPGRESAPAALAAAFRAAREYLHDVMRLPAGADLAAAPLTAARRRVSLAMSNAEGAIQRLVTDDRGHDSAVEALMTTAAYLRRLTTSVTALALVLESRAGPPPAWLGAFEARVRDALDAAAARLTARPDPERSEGEGSGGERAAAGVAALLDGVPAGPGADELARAAERIARQVEILEGAVTRATPRASPPSDPAAPRGAPAGGSPAASPARAPRA